MKRIKKRLLNENKYREVLKEKFMEDQKISRNRNSIISDFKSPNDINLNEINKFGRTLEIFNYNKKGKKVFKYESFHKKLHKAESGQINVKYKLNPIKDINSISSTKNILPYVTNNLFYIPRKKNLSLKDKDNINFTNLTSTNDSSKRNLKKKYSKTLKNFFFENENDNELNNNITRKCSLEKEKENDAKNRIQYSSILQKLDSWDKEHCKENIQKSDIALYNFLYNYYQKNNLKEELKKLIFASNLLKSNRNYNNLMEDSQNNKVLLEMLKINQKEAGAILKYNLYKAQMKFGELFQPKYSREFDENLDIDSETLNLIIQDELKNIFYNKIIKDKIKYERQLREELSKINSILFEKNDLKEEKTQKLKQIYRDKNLLKKEYNDRYNLNKNEFLLKYDNCEHHFNKLISNNTQQINNILKKENDIKDEKIKDGENSIYQFLQRNKTEIFKISYKLLSNAKKNKKRKKDFSLINKKIIEDSEKQNREFENLKKFKLQNINNELNKKLREMHNIYQNKLDDMNKEQKLLEGEIKFLKKELEYYNQVNDVLIKQNKDYYLEKLKKGYDCRQDGLIWIVINLMELHVPLEYHYFPKYLSNEQIEYLKQYATLELLQKEIKIIIKVLKKKLSKQKESDIFKSINDIDNIIEIKNKDIKHEDIQNIQIHELTYENDDYFLLAKNKIDKKFSKLYQDNFDLMKNYLKKNVVNPNFNNIIAELKKELYKGNNSFIKNVNNENNDILDTIMSEENNKKLFKLLLDIKLNFHYLEEEKKKLFEEEKENYMNLVQKIKGQKASISNVIKNEMIKKCLFGNRLD